MELKDKLTKMPTLNNDTKSVNKINVQKIHTMRSENNLIVYEESQERWEDVDLGIFFFNI